MIDDNFYVIRLLIYRHRGYRLRGCAFLSTLIWSLIRYVIFTFLMQMRLIVWKLCSCFACSGRG